MIGNHVVGTVTEERPTSHSMHQGLLSAKGMKRKGGESHGGGDVSVIVDFVAYQIDWLTSHDDIELEPELEELMIRFLKDTGKCFIDEY
jgi:hypothetical protein